MGPTGTVGCWPRGAGSVRLDRKQGLAGEGSLGHDSKNYPIAISAFHQVALTDRLFCQFGWSC